MSPAESFNYWIAAARQELSGTGWGHGLKWHGVLRLAREFIRYALAYANRMGCAARRALCLRLMNWLAADIRRAA